MTWLRRMVKCKAEEVSIIEIMENVGEAMAMAKACNMRKCASKAK